MNTPAFTAPVETVGGIELSPEFAAMALRASQSIVMLTAVTEEDSKIHMREGTAFCIDERGYFLTALHYTSGCTSSYIFVGAQILHMELVAADVDLDLALFAVKNPTSKFVPLQFAEAGLKQKDLVIGLGYPGGRLSVSLVAYVAGYQGQFVGGIDPNQPGIECPSLPAAAWFIGEAMDLEGFSGGPMLNEEGLVVAVTEMGDGDVFVAGTTAAGAVKFLSTSLGAQIR
jgi:S1-C subfamily serine protease